MKQNSKEIICSCNSVTRGEIVKAIRKKGATKLAHIQHVCGAGIRCGRCVPLIDEILLAEAKLGNANSQLRIDF